MSFFKNLFRRKENPQPQSEPQPRENITFPASIPVIPGKLNVHVFQHTIQLREGQFESLAYITTGLQQLGQREMILVIRNREQAYVFQETPVHFFRTIYHLAEKGQLVGKGGFTQLGTSDVLGWKAMLYTELSPMPDQRFPTDGLFVILLSVEELQMARGMGHTRLLSLLGMANSFYPHPYWSDIDRTQLPVEQIVGKSLIPRLQPVNLLAASVTRAQQVIQLRIPHSLPKDYFQDRRFSLENPVVLFLGLHPEANGCLVWTWDGQPSAITPGGGDGSRLGGCILILFGKQEATTVRIVEDGFGIGMTDEKWNELWDSLLHTRKEVRLEDTSEQMTFQLIWE